MIDPDTAIRSMLAEQELTVTKRDVEGLGGKIDAVNTKVIFVLMGLGIILTLLIATYGANAFFTWRLISALIDNP